jgi:hypothetical protein
MHEEVHLPYSLDGFNVRLELILDARVPSQAAAVLVPKSMRCHVSCPPPLRSRFDLLR